MATTTAQITITSADIMDNAISVTNTATLTTAGTSTGITETTGLLLTAVEIGKLYGGDWMFFPWSGGSGKDVEFTASDTTETTLEYMVFYE